jgi:hypothetical protein
MGMRVSAWGEAPSETSQSMPGSQFVKNTNSIRNPENRLTSGRHRIETQRRPDFLTPGWLRAPPVRCDFVSVQGYSSIPSTRRCRRTGYW